MISESSSAMFDPGDGKAPRAFMQWKGIDVCMDFTCECGRQAHFDGEFAYVFRCPGCGELWQMPTYVYPRKNQRTDGITPLESIAAPSDPRGRGSGR